MNTGDPRTFRVRCVQHKERGTYYDVLSMRGKVQASTPIKEGDEVVIYVGADEDGEECFWVRPRAEFSDGRFLVAFRPPEAPIKDENNG